MDGIHRIAKSWLSGETTIRAVRFAQALEPDKVIPHENAIPGVTE